MLNATDEVKSKVDIIDLLQEYIKLQQAGANWRARCPFHNEKTPSFMVSRDKQIWHCFGCGEGGDIFTFIQKIEGVDFPEALKILAQKAGVTLQKQDPAITSQRTRMLDVTDLVSRYYHKVLVDSPVAQKARDYLKSRGVDQLTIDEWQLGFSPDSWDETSNFLKKKGYGEQEIFLAGLSIKKDASRGSGYYDRFRNRLMFPIKEHNGHTVGFSARTLEPDVKEAKYVNTPQTMIFNKGQLLFGLDKAKQEVRKAKLGILMEGNLDVITSHQYGVKTAVASCGTALTIDQVKLLKRYTENVALSFDPDAAGQIAAERGIDIALQEGLNVKVIQLPPGEDPDKFVKNNGVEAWRTKIGEAKPVMEYYFAKNIDNIDLNNAQTKKEVVAKLLPIIAKLASAVEQTHWVQKLSERLSVPEDILRDILSKLFKKVPWKKAETPVLHTSMSRQERGSERLLSLLFKYPENLLYTVEHLLPEVLVGDKPIRLYTDLIIYYNKSTVDGNFSVEGWVDGFSLNLDKELGGYVNQLTLEIEDEADGLTAEKAKAEIAGIIKDLKRDFINSQLKKLGEQIKQEEAAGRAEEVKAISEKFSELTEQLYNLG